MLPRNITAYLTPSLTTALLPNEEMTVDGFKIIADAISNNSRDAIYHVFQSKLICRESSPA